MTTKNLAKVYSAELEGINARLIEVEVDMNVGLHSFMIVGLADRALSESKERVNSAIKNSGAKPPNRENRRITINLAPADIQKAGAQYDLAIALGYLLASKQIKTFDPAKKIFVGELSLDGALRPISGALNIAEMAAERGFESLFLPIENALEASAITGIKIFPLRDLRDAIMHIDGRAPISIPKTLETKQRQKYFPDLGDIVGQGSAKRALAISAAGGHHFSMLGPPGVGKSMLAQALAGILPDLAVNEAIEVTKIWSAAGLSPGKLVAQRPFRAPHQSASLMALIGGGQDPKPGEISLAHRGILFLDELPEFQKGAIEALRQPLESGSVHIARAKNSLIFPAKFTLVAAMNPCPCGYYGDAEKDCKCSAYEVIRYQKRISGPLYDRIDIQIKVGRVKIADLRKGNGTESLSAQLKIKIESARQMQRGRFKNMEIVANAEMSSRQAETMGAIDPSGEKFLGTLDKSRLSPRGYYRVLKVARTIADLEGSVATSADHLAEAFSYRPRDEWA